MYFQLMFGIALSCFVHACCIIQPGLYVMYINAAYVYNSGTFVGKWSSEAVFSVNHT